MVDSYGTDTALPHIHADGQEIQYAPYAIFLRNIEYWILRNLQVSNKGPQEVGSRAGVYIFHNYLFTSKVVHGIVLDSLYVHDVNGSRFKKEGAGAGIMVKAVDNTRHDGLQFLNCTVANTQRNGIHLWSCGTRTSDGGSGLGVNVIVRGNTIQDVPGDCILVIGCDGAVVDHNTVSTVNGYVDLPTHEASAGIWPYDSDNTLIQYNEVSGRKVSNDAQAFDSDLSCANTVIQYNYSHDNLGGFALICNLKDGQDSTNTGTIVRYNVSINDALRPTDTYGTVNATLRMTGSIEGSDIYNNIFVIPTKPAGSTQEVVFYGEPWTDHPNEIPDKVTINDNVIVYDQAQPPTLADLTQTTSSTLSDNMMLPLSPASSVGGADIYPLYRPTLKQAVTLAEQCFANGKPVSNVFELIKAAIHAS